MNDFQFDIYLKLCTEIVKLKSIKRELLSRELTAEEATEIKKLLELISVDRIAIEVKLSMLEL